MGFFDFLKDNDRIIQAMKKQQEYIDKMQKENQYLRKLISMKSEIAGNEIKTGNSFTLKAGKYIGGKDIKTGIYNILAVVGSGCMKTNKPYNFYEFFNISHEKSQDGIEKDSYNGLHITEETILDISDSLIVRFTFIREIDSNEELSDFMSKKRKLEEEIQELGKQKQLIIDKKAIESLEIEKAGKINVLQSGTYKSGEDFVPGKYDFCAIKGKGTLECSRGDIWVRMSHTAEIDSAVEYKNMSIPAGSRIEITGSLQLVMYKSAQVIPKERPAREENVISCGKYKIGTDIPEGKYIIEAKSGRGSVDDDDEIYLNFEEKGRGAKEKINLKKGKVLTIDGSLQLYLYNTSRVKTHIKSPDANDSNVLCGGVYEAGIDIPYGYYNISLVKGEGGFDLQPSNPKRFNFYETFSENGVKEYNNLLIEMGDVVTVDSGLEVFLKYSKPYKNDYISKNILREIDDVKSELNILSNKVIEKYYEFSDYENVTSESCKNKLLILRQSEKELREKCEDVESDRKNDKKAFERSTRQILRSFNMECDNISFKVGLKNIDQCRKRVQQSFETLNKLYSVDHIRLSKKLLELKLEQITLMYTYELKYQQEKDIQRAIKEQMLEEERERREIEEQKKKIEKDLQQHLGEVNRMMKYMQKTQIDAEKQLYMDKIQELEEKIKKLESDKETVLEREANAKAGFVYIISNIGSFGENVYKIGMTRRLEPMDRIKELSGASVPFEFDVHAMIFSSDAPELETTLHKHFANKAVNKINPRKEFYNVDIDEIEKVVKENYNETVQFTKIPVATEYRQSLNFG